MFSTFYGYHSILLLTALGITLSVSADEIPGGAIRTVRARCVGAATREPLEKATKRGRESRDL